jgi:adenylate cyclase
MHLVVDARAVDGSALDARLRADGARDDEIARARAEGWLPLLALDRALLPGEPVHDVESLAAVVAAEPEQVVGLWRALGFPDVPRGARVFTERDADALRLLFDRYRRFPEIEGDPSFSHIEEQVRVISGALARIAALESEDVAHGIDTLRDSGLDEDQVATAVTAALDWDHLAALVDYAHRVQLRAALWRRLARPLIASEDGGSGSLGVAFADIVGYTEMAQELSSDELSLLLNRFEHRVYDVVVRQGARVVKTIGDAVMFVGLPAAVAQSAVELAAPAEGVPPLRLGVAVGPVLERDGDYFGPVVNLASRLTDAAKPGTVLAGDNVPAALTGTAARDVLICRKLRPRHLRGIGEVPVCSLRARGVIDDR